MSFPLLTPSLNFDRASIMRAAHAEARAELAEHTRSGVKPWRYAVALKYALQGIWSDARVHRQFAVKEAARALMSATQHQIADLYEARFAATMIDSTTRMLSEVAAIDATISTLRVAA